MATIAEILVRPLTRFPGEWHLEVQSPGDGTRYRLMRNGQTIINVKGRKALQAAVDHVRIGIGLMQELQEGEDA